jgi:outer membrane protein, multidrug efflux system
MSGALVFGLVFVCAAANEAHNTHSPRLPRVIAFMRPSIPRIATHSVIPDDARRRSSVLFLHSLQRFWQIERSLRPLASTFCVLLLVVAPLAARAEPPLTLDALIERARKNDLRVKEAEGELHLLQAKYREAFWAWFPKFETTLAVAGPTPEAINDSFGGPPLTPSSVTWDLNFGKVGYMARADVTALLPIFTFGKLSALRQAGAQGPVIGEGLRRRAQDEVGYQAAQAYFGYQMARQGKLALLETQNRLNEAGNVLKNLLAQDSPQVTQLDLYKVDFFKRQVDARLLQADNGVELATAAIRLLVAAPPGQSIQVAHVDLEPPGYQLQPLDRYYDLAIQHRPELRMVNAGIIAREKEVLIRERMFLPDFGIAGFFRFAYTSSATRQRSPFAYDPYNDLAGGAALVLRTTFDIPIKLAQLDQAKAELEKLSAQRQLLQNAIRLEIQKTYIDVREALEKARVFADAERNARRWSTAAYANFEIGTGDTRELVDAFVALAQASADKLKSWHDTHVSLHGLSKAVGTNLLTSGKTTSPKTR